VFDDLSKLYIVVLYIDDRWLLSGAPVAFGSCLLYIYIYLLWNRPVRRICFLCAYE